MKKHLKRSVILSAILGLALPALSIAKDKHPVVHPSDFSGFPDFGYMVPVEEYEAKYAKHEVFRLKTDFPSKMPEKKKLPDALKINVFDKPIEYLDSVKEYCFDGNLPKWNPWKNTKNDWYHIPWLHPSSDVFPPNGGTEGFNGLIKEAPVGPYQLHDTQTGNYQIFAITIVNDFAGYTLGKMWKDPNNPDPRATDARYGGGFPKGAVFCKLLFADLQPKDKSVPYLENPIQWQGYITETWDSPNREVRYLRLLQMDIMVRDPQVEDTTGWVLGTFVYNGQLNERHCAGMEDDMACRFKNLVPLGAQWGDDPDVTENKINAYPYDKTWINPDIKESHINTSEDLPPMHLGWGGRLNGPADLNTSSCNSCHASAQFPQISLLVPPTATIANGFAPSPVGGNDDWMTYFQNIPAATSKDPRAYSTDFSLQVAMSLQNFANAKKNSEEGFWSVEYGEYIHPVWRGDEKD